MPDFEFSIEIRKQLSYFEVHLLMYNINHKTTKESLVSRLINLAENTKDERLLREVKNLCSMVQVLTSAQFAKLKEDTLLGHNLFPADYTIV